VKFPSLEGDMSPNIVGNITCGYDKITGTVWLTQMYRMRNLGPYTDKPHHIGWSFHFSWLRIVNARIEKGYQRVAGAIYQT
jgi:hypothetical protein